MDQKSGQRRFLRFGLVGALVMLTRVVGATERIEKITGEAKKNGVSAYTEQHRTSYDSNNKILTAKTAYVDPSGKTFAEISSDFSKSLSAPAHDFKDLRFDQSYGLRYEGEKLLMYVQESGEAEQTKEVQTEGKNALLVGCQGLAYYFRLNWKELVEKKTVPILFIIPGRLETYDFELKHIRTDERGVAEFDIKIKNFLLRLFAPSINLKYDTVKNRLLEYRGLSNLYDNKKNMQNVDIKYTYED